MQVAQVSAAPEATQTDEDVVLSVDNLSLDFRMRNEVLHAARNVSVKLRRGKTLCLVGESGSGKSVTARALMRFFCRERNSAPSWPSRGCTCSRSTR